MLPTLAKGTGGVMIRDIVGFVLLAGLVVGCGDSTSSPDPEPLPGPGNTFDSGNGSQGDYDFGVLPGEPGDDPVPNEPGSGSNCGDHSYMDGEECVCNDGYLWCNDDPDNWDCCPASEVDDDLEVAGLSVVGMRIRPYKFQDDDGKPVPWDWDGHVPDWILEAVEVLAVFYPEAEGWLEILEKVDEYAPILLEGTAPPDPYIKFTDSAGSDAQEYSSSSYYDDTVEPRWEDATVDAALFREAGFVIVEVWDKDVAFDDFIGQIEVPVEQLDSFDSDGGWREIEGVGTLYAAYLSAY